MWLVLCHASDASALWAHRGLRELGLAPLELVTAETLAYSLRWDHRLSPSTGVTLDLELANGRRLTGRQLRGVLNRLQMPVLEPWHSASEKDRDYVQQEMHAFYTSWLHALPCPVLNPATAESLCGAWRHPAQWTQLAAAAGLPTRPYLVDGELAPPPPPALSVIVAAGTVTGPALDPSLHPACRRLSALAQTPLLGIDFESGPGGQLLFANATPLPDLRLGGPALLQAIAATFQAAPQAAPQSATQEAAA